jgi:hypothetical protein
MKIPGTITLLLAAIALLYAGKTDARGCCVSEGKCLMM